LRWRTARGRAQAKSRQSRRDTLSIEQNRFTWLREPDSNSSTGCFKAEPNRRNRASESRKRSRNAFLRFQSIVSKLMSRAARRALRSRAAPHREHPAPSGESQKKLVEWLEMKPNPCRIESSSALVSVRRAGRSRPGIHCKDASTRRAINQSQPTYISSTLKLNRSGGKWPTASKFRQAHA
jgi:hypothetical protein